MYGCFISSRYLSQMQAAAAMPIFTEVDRIPDARGARCGAM